MLDNDDCVFLVEWVIVLVHAADFVRFSVLVPNYVDIVVKAIVLDELVDVELVKAAPNLNANVTNRNHHVMDTHYSYYVNTVLI